tara:strand:+ start:535 stop:756 length:222 start_codon:yes stop_codon:yes gene_type:complete
MGNVRKKEAFADMSPYRQKMLIKKLDKDLPINPTSSPRKRDPRSGKVLPSIPKQHWPHRPGGVKKKAAKKKKP